VVHDELKQMKRACGTAHLKTILATGELKNHENIYKASFAAMLAGNN
jgi:deoxyribose-phosphate aldolase